MRLVYRLDCHPFGTVTVPGWLGRLLLRAGLAE
jgi:hypothetical protein